ncbi:hypothetical protein BU17DRAFT_59865 [Hysterangium stoloniferum]|nr:hypothetical protein BU17DRAFT_59865 [Hysterangium stoloniferum]
MPSTNIPLFQLPHNEVSSYDHRINELKGQLAAALHVAAISTNNCSKSTTINASATTTIPVNDVTTQGKDKLTDRIFQLAGKFTILYVLWIRNIEELFKTTMDPKYQLAHRFNSVEGKQQGDYLDFWITNSYFQTQFNEGMSQAHSDAVARGVVRHDWREIHCCELIGWVQTDNGEIYYEPCAPILHHNYRGKVDIYKLFLNPVLIQLYKSIVHGQGSLDQPNHLRGVKESRWGISEITPRAIAMTGICAHFALSHDPHPHHAPTSETPPGIIDDPPLAHCSESHMSGIPCAENFPSTEEAVVVAGRKVGKEKPQLSPKAVRMTRRTKVCFSVLALIWMLAGMIIGRIRSLQNFGNLAYFAIWLNFLVIFITMGAISHSASNIITAKVDHALVVGSS